MGEQSSNKSVYPPEWWNESLYVFLTKRSMKRIDWIWEFYRRYRIETWKPGFPVDAMNPENIAKPKMDDEIDPTGFLHKLYYHAKHSELIPLPGLQVIRRTPAVKSRDIEGRFFKKSMFPDDEDPSVERLSRLSIKNAIVSVSVNLNRYDSEIVRDFESLLEEFRKNIPKPKGSRGKYNAWISKKILQTWDLRELGVTWTPIMKTLGHEDLQSARNAWTTADKYIRKMKWCDLMITD